MELEFKKASENDAPLIAELADRIWKKHYITIITMEQIDYMLDKMYSAENLLQQMKEGHEFTLVYDNNKPVGYISLSTKDNKNYFLHKFYVEVEDHRKGIGSQLFDHVLKQMKNAETIKLMVNRVNYKAINFYFKHGFVIKKVVDLDIGENFFMNDFMMIKKINNH